ncbi:MAG: heme A synthase [Planctomycetota bacterium]
MTAGAPAITPARDAVASAAEADVFPWIHRLSVLTLAATFFLIALGGIVTSLDVGMSVPDWPTTFGYSMFGYPVDKMLESMGVFYEHSHRLAGATVGILAILLTLSTWLTRNVPRLWRRIALAALVLVTLQGVLGGLRVLENDRAIAVFHALGAQIVLCTVAVLATISSPRWAAEKVPASSPDTGRLRALALLTLAVLFAHLWAGAGVRQHQARLAGHLWLAGAVTLLILALVHHILTHFREQEAFRRHALRLATLLGIQLGLGLGTWACKFGPLSESTLVEIPAVLATAHLFVGAAITATTVVLALRARFKAALPGEAAA